MKKECTGLYSMAQLFSRELWQVRRGDRETETDREREREMGVTVVCQEWDWRAEGGGTTEQKPSVPRVRPSSVSSRQSPWG